MNIRSHTSWVERTTHSRGHRLSEGDDHLSFSPVASSVLGATQEVKEAQSSPKGLFRSLETPGDSQALPGSLLASTLSNLCIRFHGAGPAGAGTDDGRDAELSIPWKARPPNQSFSISGWEWRSGMGRRKLPNKTLGWPRS